MLFDTNLQPATSLAVTSSTVVSDSIDLAVASDLGKGRPLSMHFQASVAFTSGTSLELQVITASDSALTSDIEVVGNAGVIAVSDLTLGAVFHATLNPLAASQTKGQFIGVRLIPTGTFATGTITARLTPAAADERDYYAANTPGVIT